MTYRGPIRCAYCGVEQPIDNFPLLHWAECLTCMNHHALLRAQKKRRIIMNTKAVLNILVGLALSGLVAWKGATVAAAVVAFLMAVVTLVGTLHIVPTSWQSYVTALETSLQANAPEAAAKIVRKVAVVLLVVGGLLAMGASQSACNASAEQINTTIADGVKVGTCIIGQVLGGNVTPVGLVAACSGATEQLIIDAIDDFEAAPPTDAGPVASDLAVAVSAQQKAWLDLAKQNAVTSLASKRSGK